MIVTPPDVRRNVELREKWDKKLQAMTMSELRREAKLVNGQGSTFYSLYVDYVNAELNLRERIWVTKDQQRLTVKEIDDAHLANIIAKMKRDKWRPRWLAAMKLEARRRKRLPVMGLKHQIQLEEEAMNGLFFERE